jgi:hypothetical protein
MGSIRSELKRFERLRLRPFLRRFRLGRNRPRTPTLIDNGAMAAGGPPVAEIEELLVAMIREQVRNDVGPQSTAAGAAGAMRSASLDAFVRAMLAGRPDGDTASGTRRTA